MQYRELGWSREKVSLIGLGSMTWGRQNSEAEGHGQIEYALEQGINLIDTAEMYAVPPTPDTYGRTETIIGNYFKNHGNRDRIFLASKIAGTGIPWIREGRGVIDAVNLSQALEASLKRLQTDHIDLYQLHWPNRPNYHFGRYFGYNPGGVDSEAEQENFIEVMQTMQRFIDEGKIRYYGLSNESSWGTMKYLQLAASHSLPRPVSLQNEYSLMCRVIEPDLAEVISREEIGLLAWSPLAAGLLTGKYRNGKKPAGSRWTITVAKHNQRDIPSAHQAVDQYLAVAKKHGIDPVQMALAFVNSRKFVTSTLIGATTMEQLKHNIDSINLTLSKELIADLEAVRRANPIPF